MLTKGTRNFKKWKVHFNNSILGNFISSHLGRFLAKREIVLVSAPLAMLILVGPPYYVVKSNIFLTK